MSESSRRDGLRITDGKVLPREALDDPMRPTVADRAVECLHCGRSYKEGEVVWAGGLWRCPFKDCDGAGVGCDILAGESGGAS
jgi:hypothetical protein